MQNIQSKIKQTITLCYASMHNNDKEIKETLEQLTLITTMTQANTS